jgi:hypothetical protein
VEHGPLSGLGTALKAALLTVILSPVSSSDQPPVELAWDLTISTPEETYPSWLGITEENGVTIVRVVGKNDSVHVAIDVRRNADKLTFQTQESFGRSVEVNWSFEPDMTHGQQKRSDGVIAEVIAERAPALDRRWPKQWTRPERIFDGYYLRGWHASNAAVSDWILKNKTLVSRAGGARLISNRKFEDFKLHLEYLCPDGASGGIFLRGRYELRLDYSHPSQDALHSMGAIDGFVAPSPVRKIFVRPGEWEILDISLVGRKVTAYRNGIRILDSAPVPGITRGALDSREGESGPICLVGSRGLSFRNITISVPGRN